MPELEALYKKHAGKGLTVLGISIDEGGPGPVKKFIAAKKFTYPIAIDSAKDPAWEAYQVKSVPAAFLIDRKGQLVAQWTGAAPDPKELAEKLEKLLAAD
jgi:peroxiredoxin